MSSSDFPSRNLTGNNCTYCGGSIEDNYPPAGELDHQDHPLYHQLSDKLSVNLEDQPLYHPFSTTCSPRPSFIINYPPADDQDHPLYQSSFTKRNIFFKFSIFSDCRGGPLLPLWHHRLLHAQRETMRQVQSKFLLKKTHTKMHSDNEQKHKALVFHWIRGRCDKIWMD